MPMNKMLAIVIVTCVISNLIAMDKATQDIVEKASQLEDYSCDIDNAKFTHKWTTQYINARLLIQCLENLGTRKDSFISLLNTSIKNSNMQLLELLSLFAINEQSRNQPENFLKTIQDAHRFFKTREQSKCLRTLDHTHTLFSLLPNDLKNIVYHFIDGFDLMGTDYCDIREQDGYKIIFLRGIKVTCGIIEITRNENEDKPVQTEPWMVILCKKVSDNGQNFYYTPIHRACFIGLEKTIAMRPKDEKWRGKRFGLLVNTNYKFKSTQRKESYLYFLEAILQKMKELGFDYMSILVSRAETDSFYEKFISNYEPQADKPFFSTINYTVGTRQKRKGDKLNGYSC